ncbi:hypothetical protein HAX54_016595, partial [Datura stramonium]|nr:hypothetical protein [Datura stramonium]
GGAGGVAPAFCCFPAVKVRREEGRRCSREEKGKGEGAVVVVVVVSPERREEEGGSTGSIAGNYGGCGGGRRRRGCGMVRLRWTVVASGGREGDDWAAVLEREDEGMGEKFRFWGR